MKCVDDALDGTAMPQDSVPRKAWNIRGIGIQPFPRRKSLFVSTYLPGYEISFQPE